MDIDIAESALWLLRRGFPVLERLTLELEQIDRTTISQAGDWDANHIDVTGKPGVFVTRGAVDLLVAMTPAQSGEGRLTVSGLTSPLFLLPAACRYEVGRWHFQFHLHSRAGAVFRLDSTAGVTTVIGPEGCDLTELTLVDVFEVVATCQSSPFDDSPPQPGHRAFINQEIFEERQTRSIADGVVVEPDLWERLQRLASAVLVPATKESRSRGAG